MRLCWTLLCLALWPYHTLTKEAFTSVQYMEDLYRKESRLLFSLQEAIEQQQSKLDILVQRYNQIYAQRPKEVGIEEYLSNPVDGFTLVRRLNREWPVILNLMSESYAPPEDLVKEMIQDGEHEMESAVRGLYRLQSVYNLDPDQLIDGLVENFQAITKLTAADCMEMVLFLVQRNEFVTTLSWLRAAARLVLERGDITVPLEQVASYFHITSSLAECEVDDYSPSQSMLTLLTQFPSLTSNAASAKLYRLALYPDCSWYDKSKKQEEKDMSPEQHQEYNEMCRGPSRGSSGLHCYYVHYHNAELLIAPFKLEELHISPPVVLVHDVISDSEIMDLQEYFEIVMTDCEVLENDQSSIPSTYRTCSRGWVGDDATPATAQLSRRAGLLSNLDMSTSEQHQMVSYGLGGEYKLHNDAILGIDLIDAYSIGNRIATVMFYMNDVTRGGYTVFPILKLSVAPVKGSALLWFNLLHDDRRDERLIHGGCPVLLGQKWAMTKWIHQGGQDFGSQCTIDGKFPVEYFYL